MSEAKHTPGPWEVDDANRELVFTEENGEWHYIADCDSPSWQMSFSDAETEANARLIAAAPDLLEALKIAKGYAEFARHIRVNDSPNAELECPGAANDLAKIRAAITKATGKENA